MHALLLYFSMYNFSVYFLLLQVPSTSAMNNLQQQSSQDINPFEVLSAGGFGSSQEDIHAAVEHILMNPNDDLVAMAKETGRDVYSDLSLSERKQKLNHVVSNSNQTSILCLIALIIGFFASKIIDV